MGLDESKAQVDLTFSDEIEGRESFYLDFLPRVDSALNTDDVLNDYNDGVVRGNLLEFKLRITDLNQVLFQAVKYLSARRVKGKTVPATIHLISLEDAIDYIYRSEDYRDYIEVVYVGGASKNNSAFLGGKPVSALHYRHSQLDAERLVELLREERWMRINIDENCIVGWAEHFYRICPNASKGDFLGDAQGKVKVIGEIRKPNILSEYILPYAGETNVRFKYLMDQLNDFLHKKDLGAFYTPPEFAEIAVRLLRKAIDRVPSGNDYVIIDRCAGTGNLEQFLTFTNANGIDLVQLKTGKAKKGIYNIQHINSYHSQLKRFMRGFNGVSTKYLNNYLVWNNLVNYAKESDMEKRNIFLTFVLATLKTAKCRDLSNRPAVPLVA